MPTATPRALLATDLDGTLLRGDGSVSDRTRAALRAAADSPLEVVFVTGRPLTMLSGILRSTEHLGTVIAANGAVVLDASANTPHVIRSFTDEQVRTLWAALATEFPHGEYLSMMWHDSDGAHRLDGRGPGYLAEIDRRLAAGWRFYKLLVIGPDDHTPDSIVEATDDVVGHLAEVTHSSHGMPLVELSPKGVTKGAALTDYATARGVALNDVHAVGDMPNDLPMLAVAGRAYAPSNAHELVRAAADVVLGTNDADGVAQLLEELLARHG
ncbi:MAG: HAD family phosphatase [Actinobacteria bacterium]|nr:HAD family phosphatase [Actinomycetota bacterium]MCB9411508.1 HAD family phosphatase [Actinomycetota bacterium]